MGHPADNCMKPQEIQVHIQHSQKWESVRQKSFSRICNGDKQLKFQRRESSVFGWQLTLLSFSPIDLRIVESVLTALHLRGGGVVGLSSEKKLAKEERNKHLQIFVPKKPKERTPRFHPTGVSEKNYLIVYRNEQRSKRFWGKLESSLRARLLIFMSSPEPNSQLTSLTLFGLLGHGKMTELFLELYSCRARFSFFQLFLFGLTAQCSASVLHCGNEQPEPRIIPNQRNTLPDGFKTNYDRQKRRIKILRWKTNKLGSFLNQVELWCLLNWSIKVKVLRIFFCCECQNGVGKNQESDGYYDAYWLGGECGQNKNPSGMPVSCP